MKKTLTLILLASACLWSCKKDKQQINDQENSDKANGVFRIVSNATAKYNLNILEVSSLGLPDTIQNITTNSVSNFIFGFSPRVGSRIIIRATAPNATNLNITLGYKAVRLGLDSVKRVGNGLAADFQYTIKD
ncbi:hypothetical protein [Mucilaginibacter glaciei]|uniref:Uncharacterized protein n=1 Tax=Mucilaginibacter glaciei TaxID=2772109 RepID=A0A926NZ77_9SPHI|nr:hypothetical protein [Mucilaginibacter glaciei]MBD1394633.1 hypothetical protein [Mucilaginibacter glaciei]